MRLVVVSTGLDAPTKSRCLDSVKSQRGVSGVVHVYIEASGQSPRLSATENFRRVVMALDPSDVVVCLDGDDWLAHDLALVRVEAQHALGAWVTYGSFAAAPEPPGSGRPGFTRPYPSSAYRREPWLASHLKTFRAGLYQRIREDDLRVDGEWCMAQDLAMMFPILEMAGPSRIVHISDVLYVYNWATSNACRGTLDERNRELAHASLHRQREPYAELPRGATP